VKRVRRTTGGGRFVSQAFPGWREINPLKLSLMATGWLVRVVGEVVGFGCGSDEPMTKLATLYGCVSEGGNGRSVR
jgi:hypothetical protein